MKPSRESGFSIVEVLVGLGLLSIVITYFALTSKTVLAKRAEAENLRYRSMIRDMLYNTIDCQQLKKCVGGEFVELIDQSGKVMAKADGSTTYGPWNIRAKCSVDQSLEVRLAAITPKDGRVRNDPLSGKPLDWNHAEALIFAKGTLCGKVIGSTENASNVQIIRGETCHQAQGTCPPPKESIGLEGNPSKMCCPDGSDMPEPKCPAPKRKLQSHWDREGDWGTSGNWVVLCN